MGGREREREKRKKKKEKSIPVEENFFMFKGYTEIYCQLLRLHLRF